MKHLLTEFSVSKVYKPRSAFWRTMKYDLAFREKRIKNIIENQKKKHQKQSYENFSKQLETFQRQFFYPYKQQASTKSNSNREIETMYKIDTYSPTFAVGFKFFKVVKEHPQKKFFDEVIYLVTGRRR